MRLVLLAGIALVGTGCFAQAIPSKPATPAPQLWTLPGLTPPTRDFTKLAPHWRFNPDFSGPKFTLPKTDSLDMEIGAELDPKILVRPPQSALGEQPPGKLVAQNLYPGLELRPIAGQPSGGLPIPTEWPNGRIENIPTVWPKLTIGPAAPGVPAKK